MTIMINGKAYGSGSGASKKMARSNAALETMDVLVPGFKVSCYLLSLLSQRGRVGKSAVCGVGNREFESRDSCVVAHLPTMSSAYGKNAQQH